MRTLIVFASKYGCAEKCARLVSEELKDEVDLVNLKEENKIELSKYDTIIIGGSIYMGKIQKSVTNFCTGNLEEIKKKRLGLYICAMSEGEAASTALTSSFPQQLMEVARAKQHLGGEFRLDRMGFFEKLIVKKVSKVTENKSNILTQNIHEFCNALK